jgi:hypothetical protein
MRIPELIAWLTFVLGILPLLLVGFTVAQASTPYPAAVPPPVLEPRRALAAATPLSIEGTPAPPVIDTIRPGPPDCVLHHADLPAARQLIISGHDFPMTDGIVQFQRLNSGLTFFVTDAAIIERASHRLVVDMGRVAVPPPSASRRTLIARFVEERNGDTVALSGWSAPFLVAEHAEACTSTPVIVAHRAGQVPELDGYLTEWAAVPAAGLTADTATTVYGDLLQTVTDASAALWVTWDAAYLYVAVQVTDDVITVEARDHWRSDGIELAVDGNWDRVGPGGPADHAFNLGLDGCVRDFGTPLAGSKVVTQPLSSGYTIEAAIPTTHVFAAPPGTVAGFTWALRDNDDGGDWDSWLIWAGEETLTHYDRFGELYLLN